MGRMNVKRSISGFISPISGDPPFRTGYATSDDKSAYTVDLRLTLVEIRQYEATKSFFLKILGKKILENFLEN